MNLLSELHIAVRQGNISKVSELLKEGVNVNSKSPQGRTPLHIAAEEGNAILVTMLISAGADLNARMKYGQTPLHCAADCRYSIDLSDLDADQKQLLDRRIEERVSSIMLKAVIPPDQASALVDTLKNSEHQEIIQAIIRQRNLDPQIVDEIEKALETTPQNEVGYLASARILLLAGANFNPTNNGHSPLITAIQRGSIPMTELLLDYGADIDNSKEIADCNSPLSYAIDYNRLDLVQLLLERGANPNFIDRGQKPIFGDYLLHHVIYRKDESLVGMFLKYGADIHYRDECGDTPLMLALLTGCESIALQLIEAGADINVSNPLGLTPFHGAFNYQMTRVIKILTDQNVDLDPKTLRLNWIAESEEHLEARDRLVAKNTRIANSKDYNLRFDRQSLYEKETLILFFGLDAQSQIDILPDLDKRVMFDCRMGEVFTDQSLCGLTSLYEDNLNSGLNSLISMKNEYLYSQLEYVRSLICSWIQFTESENDSFWEPESLLTPQWTLIRLSSQFIKQYLAINREITKDDLNKCYIPMNAD